MDINAVVSGLLRDYASLQTSRQRQWGYKGAATAIARLDQPLSTLVQRDGSLPKIADVGPSSTRIILEVLTTGTSPTVDEAVRASGRAGDIEKRRALREGFLSRAEVTRILRTAPPRAVQLSDYRGDLQVHSRWSDGVSSIAELAEACQRHGYGYLGVTDHSRGLPVARGMSFE